MHEITPAQKKAIGIALLVFIITVAKILLGVDLGLGF